MREKSKVDRRGFLKTSFAGVCTAGVMGTGNNLLEKEILDKGNSQDEKIKVREYRTLGRTGFKVSDIGFGAGYISDPTVLDRALKMGINYIDTAEHYERGGSERTIGQVIKKHERKSIFITTKLNLALGARTKEGIKSRFMKCLERMNTEYADCLMIHMTPTVEQVKHEPFHEAFNELKAEQKVKFFGLSNHGQEHSMAGPTTDSMENVCLAAADDGRFDVLLFVYNFLQKEQGEKIINKCKEKNMGTTLMKVDPVNFYEWAKGRIERYKERGRKLPESLVKIMDDYESRMSNVEDFRKKYGLKTDRQLHDATIKFTLSNSGIHSVCPSIKNMDELEKFVSLSGKKLGDKDTSMLMDYEKGFGNYYCRHACGICESGCPNNVPVNTIMRYNHYFDAHGREKHAMQEYAKLTSATVERCTDCSGHCEKKCPHNVPVQGLLLCAHQNLSFS